MNQEENCSQYQQVNISKQKEQAIVHPADQGANKKTKSDISKIGQIKKGQNEIKQFDEMN